MSYEKTTWAAGGAPGISATRLNNIETGIDNANNVKAPVDVPVSRGLQAITADVSTPVWIKEIVGRTLVNLLGNDGNFELDTDGNGIGNGWGSVLQGATPSLETTDVEYGSKAQRITSNVADANPSRRIERSDIPYESGKNYLLAVDAKSDAVGEGKINAVFGAASVTVNFGSNYDGIVYLTMSPSSSGTDGIIRLYNFTSVGSIGYVQFDGARLHEITSAEKTAIDAMTTAEAQAYIANKYGYVGNMKPLQGLYLRHPGKQMLPPFTAEWDVHANAEIVGPYDLKLVATGTFQKNEIFIAVSPSTSYFLTVEHDGYINVYDETNGIDIQVRTTAQTVAFTTSATTKEIIVGCSNGDLGAGTYTFTEPMLSLDADAPFEVQNDDYAYIDTAIRSNVDGSVYDTVYEIDGQLRKVKRFEYKVLDSSLPWEFNLDGTGIKSVKVPITNEETSTSTINPGGHYVVKYDGKILGKYNSFAVDGVADSSAVNGGFAFIIISDTDSGWGEDWNAGNWIGTAMIQRHVNGWKYTGTVDFVSPEWTSIYDAAVTTTDGDEAVARNLHAENGKIGYQIQYQRATEADEAVNAEGAVSFFDGLNAVELGEGVVVRERIYPTKHNSYPTDIRRFANLVGNTATDDSPFNFRTKQIIDVFKDGHVDTTNWNISTSDTAYGDYYIWSDGRAFSETAIYRVTYIAQPYQISANVESATLQRTQNVGSTVARNTQDIADEKRKVSVLRWLTGKITDAIVAITGKTKWTDTPDITLAATKTHVDDTSNPHEVTAAQIGASAILTQLKTVDGSGSGLDADEVDGLHFRINGGALQYDDGGGWTNVGGVKSVQRGRAVVTANTLNVTITAIDMDKTFVVITQSDLAGVGTAQLESWVTRRLTTTTNLELRNQSGSDITVDYEVVESH